jgi:myosin-5
MVTQRKKYLEMRFLAAVVKIQRAYRSYRVHREEILYRRKIVLIQCCWRRRQAIQQLKQLKIEAKSVGKLQQMKYQLENKVVELSQAIQAKNKENHTLVEKVSQLEVQLTQTKDKCAKLESSLKSASSDANNNVAELKKQLAAANEAFETSKRQSDTLTQTIKKRDDEIASLKAELEKTKESFKKLEEEQKNAPKPSTPAQVAAPITTGEDSELVDSLRKEIAGLKEQVSKLLAGKYKADKISENRRVSAVDKSPRIQQVFSVSQSGGLNRMRSMEWSTTKLEKDDESPLSATSTAPEMDVSVVMISVSNSRHLNAYYKSDLFEC